MEQTQTLKETLDEFDDNVVRDIHKMLVTSQMLANVQMNLMNEIQYTLTKYGKYKYEVKHNLKNAKREIKKNVGQTLFRRLGEEATKKYVDDFDTLEGMILDWMNKVESKTYDKELK